MKCDHKSRKDAQLLPSFVITNSIHPPQAMDTLYIQKEVLTLFYSKMLSHCFYYISTWHLGTQRERLKKDSFKNNNL